MLELDGSTGEGGGQVLRTALALSMLTRLPFRMTRIRAGRQEPGLKEQHFHTIKILQEFAGCRTAGARPGSTELSFWPGTIRSREIVGGPQTAGSIPLILQTLIPVLAFGGMPTHAEIIGGTDVAMAPTCDYVLHTVLGVAQAVCSVSIEVLRRGFFPKGGGRVALDTRPRFTSGSIDDLIDSIRSGTVPIDLAHRTPLLRIRVCSLASRSLQERNVSERQAASACQSLGRLRVPFIRQCDYAPTHSPGSALTLVAEFEGGRSMAASSLGERRKSAEQVGAEAASALAEELETGGVVDRFAGDQLILWLALCGGTIRPSLITPHTRTAIWVTEQFLGPRFVVEDPLIRAR